MTHDEKLRALRADLERRGVPAFRAAPPLFRLLWALGIAVPPPVFWRFRSLWLFGSAVFAVPLAAFIWFCSAATLGFLNSVNPTPPAPAERYLAMGLTLTLAPAWALLCGLIIAAPYQRLAARLRLPGWDPYGAGDIWADLQAPLAGKPD